MKNFFKYLKSLFLTWEDGFSRFQTVLGIFTIVIINFPRIINPDF
jgi:hypothetical protein